MQGSEKQEAAAAPEPRGEPLAIGTRPEGSNLPRPLGRQPAEFLKTRQIFASREPRVSGQRAVFRRTPPPPMRNLRKRAARARGVSSPPQVGSGPHPAWRKKTRCQFPAARVRQTAGSRQRAALAAVGLPGGPSPYALPADSLAVHTARYFSEADFGCRPLSGANLRFPISATRAESRQPGFMAGKPPEVGTAPRGLLFQPCVQPVTGWFVSRQSAGIPTAPNRREKSRRISRPRVRREHPWFLCQ